MQSQEHRTKSGFTINSPPTTNSHIQKSRRETITSALKEERFLDHSRPQTTAGAKAVTGCRTESGRGQQPLLREAGQTLGRRRVRGWLLRRLLSYRAGLSPYFTPGGEVLIPVTAGTQRGLDRSTRSASQDMKVTCDFQPFPASAGKLQRGLFSVTASFDPSDLTSLSRLKPRQLMLFACLDQLQPQTEFSDMRSYYM